MSYALVGESKDYKHGIECIPVKHPTFRSKIRDWKRTDKKINLKENILFGLGIEAETVVDTNIPDICTIEINIIKKSHPIEEKETKNLEKQWEKHLRDLHQGSINKLGAVVTANVW